MGTKGHLTFQKGQLTFGGGASAPHAPRPPPAPPSDTPLIFYIMFYGDYFTQKQ